MKTEYALRYLLLRHLKRRERLVPSAQFLEVTRSLHVSVDRDGFVVTWSAGATPYSRNRRHLRHSLRWMFRCCT